MDCSPGSPCSAGSPTEQAHTSNDSNRVLSNTQGMENVYLLSHYVELASSM